MSDPLRQRHQPLHPAQHLGGDVHLIGVDHALELIRRRLVVSYPQHFVGQFNQIGLAFDFSDTPAVIQGPPLIVGEQTVAILTELGYSTAEIEELAKAKAILAWAPESAQGGMPQNPWAEKTA